MRSHPAQVILSIKSNLSAAWTAVVGCSDSRVSLTWEDGSAVDTNVFLDKSAALVSDRFANEDVDGFGTSDLMDFGTVACSE